MSERTRRFVSELQQLGELFGGAPQRRPEAPADLIEIRPGIWVQAVRPFGSGPGPRSRKQQRKTIEGVVTSALGLDDDEAQELGRLLWRD